MFKDEQNDFCDFETDEDMEEYYRECDLYLQEYQSELYDYQ